MGDPSSLNEEVSKILFHLENGDSDLLAGSEYQIAILSTAKEAIRTGHPDGSYLLSIFYDLQGNSSSKRVQLKLEAAMNGNSNAIMEFVNSVGHNNVTSMALLMARKNATGSDTASLYQDYDYVLETCDKAFLRDITELAESITQNLVQQGMKFSW